MTIDTSVKDGKLVYQKGLPIKTGFSQRQWAKMLKDYNPSRNSRQMTRTEYACRNLFLIQRLVESGYEIAEAWEAVCDDSRKIGHYRNSDNPKNDFEPTGSREVCGFCDLGNACKFLAEDPWEEAGDFWAAGGYYYYNSYNYPVADFDHFFDVDFATMMVLSCLRLISSTDHCNFQERDGICFAGSIFKIYRKKNAKMEIKNNKLIIIPKIEKYIEYMLAILIKLPRTEKFSIGTEIKTSMYEMLKHILFANKIDKRKRLEIYNIVDSNI